MTPLGLFITLSLALAVLSQSRRIAAASIIAAVCYLTEAQVVELGFHFTAVRIVLLAGLIRVVARGEMGRWRLNTIDRTVIFYALAILIISTLRVGTVEQFVYRVGGFYNVLLAYFVFRSLVREKRDYHEVLARVAFVIVPFALLMLFESLTDRNLFSGFGGVLEFSWVRDGHVRCQGPFHNPITAGAFGATFAMLFTGLLFAGERSRSIVVGLIASLFIVICAHSSGPFLGCVLGVLALACWRLRRHMRTLRWGIVTALVGLQLVMKAPIWFLIARVSELTGGGGYHRAYLIDQFVNRFSSWWLAGTSDTHDWFAYQLPDGTADLTNIFVADAVHAGLLGMILSVALVVRCFRRLGAAIKINRGYEPDNEKLLWGIGSTLVGSLGILFSVTYMDQMQVVWYFLLACIAGVELRKPANRQALCRDDQRTDPSEFLPAGGKGTSPERIKLPVPNLRSTLSTGSSVSGVNPNGKM
jgi:hypothetical protein